VDVALDLVLPAAEAGGGTGPGGVADGLSERRFVRMLGETDGEVDDEMRLLAMEGGVLSEEGVEVMGSTIV